MASSEAEQAADPVAVPVEVAVPGRGSEARVGATACAVVIPAFNEEDTVGDVIRVALAAAIGPVLVVDDGSDDDTAAAATAAGARVLRLSPNRGKGGALHAGAEALEARVLVLLDSDLLGLQPRHVVAIARPVLEGAVTMARGVFRGGQTATTLAQRIAPQLSGQRALPRGALLSVPGLAESRFGAEVAINRHAARRGWTSVDVPLDGASQRMKEQKRGILRGLWGRAGMYRDILRSRFFSGPEREDA